MRKILSLVLVAAMLVCGMVVAPVSNAAEAGNVTAVARYFGGTTTYGDVLGPNGSAEVVDEWEIKAGDASKGVLFLDGVIEDGEWGSPIAIVDSKYAPNNDGKTYGVNNLFECPSAENTFYYYDVDSNKNSLNAKGMYYELYMMWDESFLYVGAKVDDRDGWSNSNSAENVWDGDAFQFRVDTEGANSVCADGETYDAAGVTDPAHPDRPHYVEPWAGITYGANPNNRPILSERVGNFMTGFTTSEYSEIYDAAHRYTETATEINYTDETTNTVITETQLGPADISYFSDFSEVAYSSIQSVKRGNVLTGLSHKTDYEVAIPWSLIEEGYTPEVDAELGFAATVMNGTPSKVGASNAITSWLSWGTGITHGWETHNPQTAGGSNAIILSGEERTALQCTHPTYNAATCTEPETCAECGHQRGYTIGHTFDFTNPVVQSTENDGSLVGTCKVCGTVENYIIPAKDYNIKATFKTSDAKLTADSGFYSGYTANWRISDEMNDSNERVGAYATLPDGTVMTAFDNRTFPEIGSVMDLYTNGEQYAVEEYITWVDKDGESHYPTNTSQAGTYFAADSFTSSYSYKMDLYFPDLVDMDADPDSKSHYNPGIRNQVGSTKYGFYNIGMHLVEGEWYFAIIHSIYGDNDKISQAEFEEQALDFVKATPEQLSLNTWHEYALMFDDVSDTAFFAWDGEIVLAASDYHMDYASSDGSCTMFWRRFGLGAYVKDCIYGTSTVFNDYVENSSTTEPPVGEKFTVTVDGVATEYAAGETVELVKEFYVDKQRGYRFQTWEGDIDVLADATQGVTSFVMPSKNVTLTSKYLLVGDVNQDNEFSVADLGFLKIVLLGNGAKTSQCDVDGDGGVNSIDMNLMKRALVGAYTPDK